jgi:hypothetical protein
LPVVRAHHGLGFHLGQDDDFDFDFGDFSTPDPVIDTPPSMPIVSSTPAPVYPSSTVMPVLAPAPSASSIMLPSSLQTVSFADGTTGFFDPQDGTYYDSQGNDVTGYAQNFGGVKITGTATPAQIAAAEGISTPGAAPRVAAPATSAIPPPSALQALTTALFGSSVATMPKPATATAATASAGTIAGMSSSTLLLLGGGLLAVVALMGRK